MAERFFNSAFLRNRVAELGIKQWWLAEQIGVDRKTVIRWLQGKVRTMQPENAEALATVLGCRTEDFCGSTAPLATPEDQRTAALLLAQSSLAEKLGPPGEWNVIESLLKATIVPDLPLSVLGQLYCQLTVASWRQSKLEQAETYCAKAFEIAEKAADNQIRAEALLSRGNLLSWKGKTGHAIAAYEEALRLAPHFSGKTLGSLHSNLGAVLYESGELEAGLEHQLRAIDCFLREGRPQNLSIEYCHIALLQLLAGRWEEAEEACGKSVAFAARDGYRRGIAMGALVQAEVWATAGRSADASAELAKGLSGFRELGIEEGLNYEFAARVSRLTGRLEEAQAFAEKGLAAAKGFPVYEAALWEELARVRKARERPAAEIEEALGKARGLYLDSGCRKRAERLMSL